MCEPSRVCLKLLARDQNVIYLDFRRADIDLYGMVYSVCGMLCRLERCRFTSVRQRSGPSFVRWIVGWS